MEPHLGPTTAARALRPAVVASLVAALIAAPLAESVFQVPIQVSDSLEAMVIGEVLVGLATFH